MPSAARAVGAVGLAVLAFVVSGMIMPLMPEGTGFGYFTYVNIVIGLFAGWITIGKRMGRGWTSAINMGMTGAAVLVFWGLFVQATNEMVRLAMRNRYDGPFDALVAIFQIGTEYFMIMATVPVLSTLVIGGALTGIAAERASRTWR